MRCRVRRRRRGCGSEQPTLARIVRAPRARPPARVAAVAGRSASGSRGSRRGRGPLPSLQMRRRASARTEDLMSRAQRDCCAGWCWPAIPERDWLAVLHAARRRAPRRRPAVRLQRRRQEHADGPACVASGLDLVTDDYAPLEIGTRLLWPVPFGLSVKEGSWPVLAPHFPDLGGAPAGPHARAPPALWPAAPDGDGPHSAACLVFPLYQPGASVELTPLDPPRRCAADPQRRLVREFTRAVGGLVDWIAALPAYALDYGDGADAVAAVRASSVRGDASHAALPAPLHPGLGRAGAAAARLRTRSRPSPGNG